MAAHMFEDVVCPFCGLGCDDVSIKVDDASVTATGKACPGAARLFRRDGNAMPGPRVTGAPATADEAARTAASILDGAASILFAGLGTDIAGMRALVSLGERVGGAFDHYASDGFFSNLATAQRAGWIATTIAEIRNRCDLLLVVGSDPAVSFERLFERLLPPAPLFLPDGIRRRVVFLGAAPGPVAAAQLGGCDVEAIPVADGALADVLAALQALVASRPTPLDAVGGVSMAVLGDLADALRTARYAVLAWHAGDLAPASAPLIVEAARNVVDTLNRATRAALFPLGGRDGLIGVNTVMLWRLGFPLRTAIRGGRAAHDPVLHAAGRAAADADVMVWVSAFRPEPPPHFDGRLVALAHPDTLFAREPDVFLPVGTPGIDHDGHVFRMDSVVALPLSALRPKSLPSVAETARAVSGARS